MRNYKTKCPEPSSKLGKVRSNFQYNTTLDAQRKRILQYLQKGLPLTTIKARHELDIMHPAGRVMELRKKGYQIKTYWETVETALGKHRIAKYFLLTNAGGENAK
jgi:hypothetical protein